MRNKALLEIVVVILAAVAVNGHTIVDPDLGWALDAGARILAGDGIPRVNDRSFVEAGHAVILHGWALDTFFAWAQAHWGGTGLAAARLFIVALDAAAIWFAVSRVTTSRLLRVLLPFAAIAVSPSLFDFMRAQIISFAFFALLTAAFVVGSRRALWSTVPLFALWPNLHGAFVAGLVLSGAYAFATALEKLLGRRPELRLVDVAGVPIASGLATLCTPYGFDMWKMVRATTDSGFSSLLSEWFPTWSPMVFASYWPAYVVLMTALIASLALLPREDLRLRLVAVAIAFLMTSAARHMRIAPAVIVPIFAYAVARFVDKRAADRISDRVAVVVVATLACVAVVALVLEAGTLFVVDPRARRTTKPTSIAFLVMNRVAGNVWTPYDLGGDVLWACRACNVEVDGRAQVAYEPSWVVHEMRSEPLVDKELLAKLHVDYAIVVARDEVLRMVAPDYFPLYCDGDTCVLSGHDADKARSYRFPPDHLPDAALFDGPGRPHL